MTQPTQPTRYHPALIALHWLVLLLIVGAYVTMEFRGIFPRGSMEREFMKSLHYSFGLTILLSVILRAVIRLRAGTPAIEPALEPMMKLAATGAHIALYAFMIVMPLLGWGILSAEGKDIAIFGLPVFPLVSPGEDTAEIFEEAHEVVATIGYVLIGLHAVAALYHHYLRGDNTLRRMLPGTR